MVKCMRGFQSNLKDAVYERISIKFAWCSVCENFIQICLVHCMRGFQSNLNDAVRGFQLNWNDALYERISIKFE